MIWVLGLSAMVMGALHNAEEHPWVSLVVVAVLTTICARLLRRLAWPTIDYVGLILGLYAWIAAVAAVGTMYLGGSIYSPAMTVFTILAWTALPASIVASILGAMSYFAYQRSRANLIMGLPLALVFAWIFLIQDLVVPFFLPF